MPSLTCPNLLSPNIRHGFFTRKGGHSSGLYSSMNCGPGSDDNPHLVLKNRQRILLELAPQADQLCGLYQIHSNIVHFLEEPWTGDNLPKGDAMVTRQKHIALGILTADCAPVLFADPKNGVIGAAHAGWKGALTGILKNTLRMMCHNGAEISSITATVGPCIAQENYEVGPEFLTSFKNQQADHRQFFQDSPNKDHYLFDLKAFCMDRLTRYGLKNITCLPHDTYARKDLFFSYRRATHHHEKDYGRQISTIMLL
ncbi:MAG: peptidoglycan editing factor PgeF [Emcibacter sp.]|nr:peptidoglycan editing factor PgeF [Emcibacter sp.]